MNPFVCIFIFFINHTTSLFLILDLVMLAKDPPYPP
jgi:hypothetical protein